MQAGDLPSAVSYTTQSKELAQEGRIRGGVGWSLCVFIETLKTAHDCQHRGSDLARRHFSRKIKER